VCYLRSGQAWTCRCMNRRIQYNHVCRFGWHQCKENDREVSRTIRIRSIVVDVNNYHAKLVLGNERCHARHHINTCGHMLVLTAHMRVFYQAVSLNIPTTLFRSRICFIVERWLPVGLQEYVESAEAVSDPIERKSKVSKQFLLGCCCRQLKCGHFDAFNFLSI